MKQLDPIEELYNMYLEEEDSSRIVEIEDMDLDFGLEDGLAVSESQLQVGIKPTTLYQH